MVTFATQNAIMDPPFTRLDVLVCRNLLIYLGPDLQKRLLPLFHYSLNPGGILFLGSAETAGGQTGLFAPLAGKFRLYRRGASQIPLDTIPFPAVPASDGRVLQQPAAASKPVPDIQALADQVLLQRFAPAAVVVNGEGDILFVSGRTGKYLEPAAGKANWNIFAMAREGLRGELPEAFRRAVHGGGLCRLSGVRLGPGETAARVDVTIQALSEPEALRGTVLIAFSDVAAAPPEEHLECRAHRRRVPDPGGRCGPARGARGPRGAAGPPAGDAGDARADADLPGGAEVRQRGAPVDQRGAPVDQRGADDLQGGDAVAERGASDRQLGADRPDGRADPGERRPEQPPQRDRHRHRLPRRRGCASAGSRPARTGSSS